MMTFHANGKLLLTGEYFILDGAAGLALPTKFGQTLTVEPSSEKGIFWNSMDYKDEVWFQAKFDEQLAIVSASNEEIAKTLQQILSHCHLTAHDLRLTTTLDFPQNWGLGSSSTLISLIAQWTETDPYALLEKTFGGSGYDIACATAKSAITYQMVNSQRSIADSESEEERRISTIDYRPPFQDHLYFVHLNQKQNSREGIQHYRNLKGDKSDYIDQISSLTEKIILSAELDEFCYYLEVHENIIAQSLQLQKVKDICFPDFPGTVKSLGAWGGDFVLAASDESPEMIRRYFTDKGFPVILPFAEVILT
jgi:mevalonate kinase